MGVLCSCKHSLIYCYTPSWNLQKIFPHNFFHYSNPSLYYSWFVFIWGWGVGGGWGWGVGGGGGGGGVGGGWGWGYNSISACTYLSYNSLPLSTHILSGILSLNSSSNAVATGLAVLSFNGINHPYRKYKDYVCRKMLVQEYLKK